MPSTNVCVYRGCTSTKRKDPNLTFHRFPQDEQTRRKWITQSGNPDLVLQSKEQIENARMCCKHFSDSDFVAYGTQGKRTIRTGALPIDASDANSAVADATTTNPASMNSAPANPALEITTNATSPNPKTLNDETTNPEAANLAKAKDQDTSNDSPVYVIVSNIIDEATSEIPWNDAPSNSATVNSETTSREDGELLASHDTIDNAVQKILPSEARASVLSRKKNVKEETPKERQLKRLVKLLRAEIKILRQKSQRLDIAAKKNASAVAFAKAAHALNDDQLNFFKMQMDHAKKRSWSEDEKQFALSLYYKSPRAYNWLRDDKHFALPCVSLIRSWANEMDVDSQE